MIFTKLLGVADLACVLLLLFTALFPEQWISTGATYLMVKGGFFAFLGDIISFLDIGVGIYLVLMVLGISSTVLTIIAMIYLLQKAIFSLL